jgi:hypothetical protein
MKVLARARRAWNAGRWLVLIRAAGADENRSGADRRQCDTELHQFAGYPRRRISLTRRPATTFAAVTIELHARRRALSTRLTAWRDMRAGRSPRSTWLQYRPRASPDLSARPIHRPGRRCPRPSVLGRGRLGLRRQKLRSRADDWPRAACHAVEQQRRQLLASQPPSPQLTVARPPRSTSITFPPSTHVRCARYNRKHDRARRLSEAVHTLSRRTRSGPARRVAAIAMRDKRQSEAGRSALLLSRDRNSGGARSPAVRSRRLRDPSVRLVAGEVEFELRETLGVEEGVDRGDLAARDGEAHHREQSSAWGHDGSGGAVDERGSDERMQV